MYYGVTWQICASGGTGSGAVAEGTEHVSVRLPNSDQAEIPEEKITAISSR